MARKCEPITAVNNECAAKFLRLTQQKTPRVWQKTKLFRVAKYFFFVVDDVRRTWLVTSRRESQPDECQPTDKANNGCCWQSGHLCGHRFAAFSIVHSFIVWMQKIFKFVVCRANIVHTCTAVAIFIKTVVLRREMKTFVCHFPSARSELISPTCFRWRRLQQVSHQLTRVQSLHEAIESVKPSRKREL